MTDFIRADLRGSRFERVDLSGPQFRAVDLSGAQFREVGLSGVVMRGVEMVDVDIHGEIVNVKPGARILELGDWGMRPASWSELEIVAEWREFLREPQSFLRHLLDRRDTQPPD